MFDQIIDFDMEYKIHDYTAGADAIVDGWERDAKAFRESGVAIDTCGYGEQERELFDFIRAPGPGPSNGTVIFIHGGYWVSRHKNDFTFVAKGPLAQGWNVALVGYTLAPQASIARICRQVVAAIEEIAGLDTCPLRLTGHSAGGHLATMAMTQGMLHPAVTARVEHVVSISGVHDLRPLPLEFKQQIDPKRQLLDQYSPVLSRPQSGVRLTCWVGTAERPEFIRQSRLLADMWLGLGAATRLELARNRNHFDVINDLTDAHSALTQCLLKPMPAGSL